MGAKGDRVRGKGYEQRPQGSHWKVPGTMELRSHGNCTSSPTNHPHHPPPLGPPFLIKQWKHSSLILTLREEETNPKHILALMFTPPWGHVFALIITAQLSQTKCPTTHQIPLQCPISRVQTGTSAAKTPLILRDVTSGLKHIPCRHLQTNTQQRWRRPHYNR